MKVSLVRAGIIGTVSLVLSVLAVSAAPPVAAVASLHGISFLTGCESPVALGEKTRCDFLIANTADADTLTVTSFTEVLDTGSGLDASDNLLPTADLTFSGGASCNAEHIICTLPLGGRITTASPVLFHTTTGADFSDHNPLSGTATLQWQDLCTSEAIGCPSGNQFAEGTLVSVMNKLVSSTDTAIHNSAHQVVAAVEAGTRVHDFVQVSGGEGSPTPTGSVNVDLFTNGDCTGDADSNSGAVALVNGSVDVGTFAPRLAAGSYAFVAHYPGDSIYTPSDGNCEPLSVVDAAISIAPNGISEVSHKQSFTVTVLENTGDGSGFVPAPGITISYTLTDFDGAAHTTAGKTQTTCAGTTDANGRCNIVFTSSASGKVIGTASVTILLQGLAITRDTDPTTPARSGPGGSGPAMKRFVDAHITIASDATLEVGETHTFTVTVKRNLGGGAGFVNAPDGTKPTVSLMASNGAEVHSNSNTCATTGTLGGKCRVTFTSPTAGMVTGTASVTLTVNGVNVTRDTDPATATFVLAFTVSGVMLHRHYVTSLPD